jgi:hypothetical protein
MSLKLYPPNLARASAAVSSGRKQRAELGRAKAFAPAAAPLTSIAQVSGTASSCSAVNAALPT